VYSTRVTSRVCGGAEIAGGFAEIAGGGAEIAITKPSIASMRVLLSRASGAGL